MIVVRGRAERSVSILRYHCSTILHVLHRFVVLFINMHDKSSCTRDQFVKVLPFFSRNACFSTACRNALARLQCIMSFPVLVLSRGGILHVFGCCRCLVFVPVLFPVLSSRTNWVPIRALLKRLSHARRRTLVPRTAKQ